jgi:hypothetical protein
MLEAGSRLGHGIHILDVLFDITNQASAAASAPHDCHKPQNWLDAE